MSEPAWPWMKRQTLKKGAPTSAKEAEKVWTRQWANLEQGRIQRWIERIIRHIKEVIRLEGGNEYREGSTDIPFSSRKARENEMARRNY